MDLYQLKALCAVVDRGSFAAAAESLGLTQPALSMQLSRLEDETGLALFLKTGRRKVLGAEGLVVLSHARRILSDVSGLEDELEALRGLESGTLAVAASDTVLRHLLADPLAAFAARWPRVHLHVWNRPSGETLDLVRDGRADLGVLTLPVDAPDLEVQPWRQFAWVAAGTDSLGKTGSTGPVSAQELASRTLILLEPGTRLHGLWSKVCLERGLPLGPHVETGATDIQLDFAARGLGIAVVPDYALGARADLVVRPIPDLGTGTLALVQRPGRRPRAVEAFLGTSFPRLPSLG